MKVQSVIVMNVISARIILHLIKNSSVKVTGRVYNVRGSLSCNSLNVVYIFARIVETSMQVHPLILRLDLESINATSRLRKIGVILTDILTTNVVTEAILTYFSKYSQQNLCKMMLTWKVNCEKERIIDNVRILFRTCIQVKEKVLRKTDGVSFVIMEPGNKSNTPRPF